MSNGDRAAAQELRPLLHAKIEQLDPHALALTHQFIREIEIDREIEALRDDLADSFDAERAGAVIREFRKRHPYR